MEDYPDMHKPAQSDWMAWLGWVFWGQWRAQDLCACCGKAGQDARSVSS